CGNRVLDLAHTHVMGILNATPDSFSDGGRYSQLDAALRHAEAMVLAGATLIDVGGESTRPGARPVSPAQEVERVAPVVEIIARELDVIISVDTSTPEVMLATAGLGAGMINDVRSLQRPGALEAAASTGLPVCLMHMQGEPGTSVWPRGLIGNSSSLIRVLVLPRRWNII
ncbi:Dihydropteroate synthase, partial [Pseudomonas syringae pv. maculicola]